MNIFLHKKIKNIPRVKKFNIILSPEFYWIKIFEIPTNSLSKAKKLAPSLFEDFIDISDKSFYLKRIDNFKYIVIAYSEDEIRAFLKEKNIFNKIKSIHFAQFELDFEGCVEIDEIYLINQEGLILKYPMKLDCPKVNLNNIKLSKEKLILNEFSLLNNTQAKILISLFLITSVINFTKYFYIKHQINSIPNKIESLKQEYHLYPSLFQTKSVIKELLTKKERYKNFRDVLSKALNFKKHIKGQIVSIEYNNKLIVKIKSTNISGIINYFKQFNVIKKEINKDEIKIWIDV